jgi:PAS domain S-box-containing protein
VERRYRTALKHSPVIFSKTGTDLRYEWIHNPHDDFVPDAARGMRDDELDSGPGVDALMDLKRRALEEKRQLREEITFERSDGPQTYDITVTPLREGPGESVTGLSTASLNVTRRREAEQKLRETKERYRTLVDHFPGGVFLYDEDLRCTLAGGEQLKKVGLSPGEVEGKRPAERYPPEIAGPLMEGLRAALSGEKSTLQQSYQGRDYHVETLPVRAGEVCMAVSMDVTEQRETTRQLREERDRLNRILQTSPVAITFLDNEGRLVEASSRAEEVLGLNEKDLTDRTYNDPEWRIRGPDGEPMPEEQLPFRRVMETGEAVFDIEHLIEWPGGTQRLLSVSGAPLRSPNGDLEGAVFHVADITERREATKKLQKAKREAEEADRLKTALLSNMNHELRTPLTSIISFAELIEKNPEMAGRFTSRILGGAKRLLYTLNTVMEFAELEGTGHSVNPGLCQLRDVVRSAVNGYRERAREKGLEMEVEISALRPVYLDAHLTERVLAHLLHNAVKFTEEGKVSVTARAGEDAPGQAAKIQVEDTGVGIDPAFLPHVYEEFAQGSTGFDRTHEGNGLGLTVAKRLVEQMGGTISIESEPDTGTRVTVRLPDKSPAPQ